MQYEGTPINVPIKGIMRAGTTNVAPDGAMNEVIGMEFKDGSYLPYAVQSEQDKVVVGQTSIIKTYIHKISDGTSNTLYLSSGRDLYFPTGTGDSIPLGSPIVTTVRDVAFVGNVMCVATDRGLEYYTCESGVYHKVQTDYYPRVDLRVTAGLYEKDSPEEVDGDLIGVRHISYLVGEMLSYGDNEDTYIKDKTRKSKVGGGLTAAKGEVRDRGGLTGYVLACVAYRNKNGDIIAADAPVLLSKPYALLEKKIIQSPNEYPQQCSKLNLGPQHGDYKGYFHKYWSDAHDTVLALSDSEVDASPIFQFPFDAEVDWDRTETNMTEEGFRRLYKKDNVGSFTTDGGLTVGGTETNRLQHLYRSNPYTERRFVESNLPLSPELFCTEIETQLIGGGDGTQNVKRDYTFQSFAVGNTLQYRIPTLSAQDRRDLYSVCIFISDEIDPYVSYEKIDDALMATDKSQKEEIYTFDVTSRHHTCWATSYYAKKKSAEALIEDIKDIKSLYLVKEINIDDITPSNDWISIDLKGLLGETLLTRTSLPITAFNKDKYYPNMLDTYNLRLHMSDYTTELFKGHPITSFQYLGGEYQYHTSFLTGQRIAWEILVELDDGNGRTSLVNYGDNLGSLTNSLSPFISYPSKFAKSIKIRIYNYTPLGGSSYEASFSLTYHERLGISYYVDPDLKPIIPQLMQQAVTAS